MIMSDHIHLFVAAHQDPNLQIVSSDSVKYAVYEENGERKLYFLNTDYDLSHEVVIYTPEGRKTISIKPTEMKICVLE